MGTKSSRKMGKYPATSAKFSQSEAAAHPERVDEVLHRLASKDGQRPHLLTPTEILERLTAQRRVLKMPFQV